MKILNDFMIINLGEFMASKNISVEHKLTSWFALAPIIKKHVARHKPEFVLFATSETKGNSLRKYDVSILNRDTTLEDWGTVAQEIQLEGKLSDFMKTLDVTSELDEFAVTAKGKTGIVKLCIAESKSKEAKSQVKTNYSVSFSDESTQKYLIIDAENTAETFWGARFLIHGIRQ